MKIQIEEVESGYIVKVDESVYVYEYPRTIELIEKIGRLIHGKRIGVIEK